MGQYRRKLAKGTRWFYSGQHKGVKYHSIAEFATRTECRNAEAEIIRKIDRESIHPKERMTFLELCNKRLDYIKAVKSKSYYRQNKKAFSTLLKTIGDIQVEKISKAMIHDHLLKESLRLKKIKKDNYRVNADLRIIRALFNYAINELEVLDINPTRKLRFYPINKKLKYIPPEEHIDLVYKIANPDQKKLISFAKETGCRIGEALRATGKDIDLEMNLLTLWTRKKKDSNLTPRRIPLPECLRNLKVDGRLFPQWSERPHFLESICKKAIIPLFGWHAFRHRKASMMAQKNVPLIEIMNHLGHESAVVTQHYLRLLGYSKY